MPGARFARYVVIAVVLVIVFSLILSVAMFPLAY
jgi:hypothetical protein